MGLRELGSGVQRAAGIPRVAASQAAGWARGVVPSLHPQALTALPPPLQSTAKKMDIIKGLFVACRYSEARFIAR